MDANIIDFTKSEIEGLKAELEKHGVEYEQRSFVQLSAEGGDWPSLLIHALDFGPLALALAAYFKHRKRKLSIKSPKGEVTFENFSPSEIERILNSTKGIIHIEGRPSSEK
jgi:hypothetical protein